MANSHLDTGVDDGWPWNCARCGTTVYHDVIYCGSCDRRQSDGGDPGPRYHLRAAAHYEAWIEWIERQSYPSLVATAASIATAELLLTAFWIRLLFQWLPSAPSWIPI